MLKFGGEIILPLQITAWEGLARAASEGAAWTLQGLRLTSKTSAN